MNIRNLNTVLVHFINVYLPSLDWVGRDNCASAELLLDEDSTIDCDLMLSIATATLATKSEDFELTIRPSENKLILYYID